ncbi:MAG: low molecular weight protein-tyrosine-phosphatase [Longimicrobiales bacterium]
MDSSLDPPGTVSVLFVCLGNICRSPLAEGVFRHRVEEAGLQDRIRIDSAGTGGWHVGEPPDARSREVARAHGVSLDGQSARRVSPDDLRRWDWIVAMDRANLDDLERLRERHGGDGRIVLLRDFDPEPGDGEVPDPYYGGPQGFDRVYEMVDRSCAALLERVLEAS